VAELVMLRIK